MRSVAGRKRAVAAVRPDRGRFGHRFTRGLAASVGLVLLAGLSGIVSAGPAEAVSGGYENLKNWAVTGQSAFAKLPGTRSGDGDARFQPGTDGRPPRISEVTTGTWPGALVSEPGQSVLDQNAGCLNGMTQAWVAKNCFTRTATLTFAKPVVNPELVIGLGGVWTAPEDRSWCTAGWENLAITGVNGAAPGGTAFDAISVGARATYTNGTLSILDSTVQTMGACAEPNSNSSVIRVRGLVSSVSFTFTYRAVVTKLTASLPEQKSISVTGGIWMQVAVPVADLAVAKAGPAEVPQGGTITWTINVANNGGADSHGFIVKDAVPPSVTSPTLVSAPAGCTLVGSDLLCQRPPDKCTIAADSTLNAVSRLTCGAYLDADAVVLRAGGSFGPIVLSGVAGSAVGSTISNTATVAGVDTDPDATNNTSTATSAVLATLAVYKSFPSGRRNAADQVTLTAESSTKVLGTATTAGAESGLQNQQASEYVTAPVAVGTKVTISESMTAGSASSADAYTRAWRCYYLFGTTQVQVASGSGSSGTFTFPASLPAGTNRVVCEFSNAPRSWNVTKTAALRGAALPAGGAVAPGDVIDYTVTATNTGTGDVDGVVLTDDLTDVLDDSTFVAGSAKLTIGSGAPTTVSDPNTASTPIRLTTAAFTVPAGQKATLTYSVKVRANAWLATLTNRVTGTGGTGGSVPPTDCFLSQNPLAAQCSTTNRTNAKIEIEKVDQAGSVRLDGSSFEVLADTNGTPGAVLTQYPTVSVERGLFSVSNLPVGTYWLRESKAPAGFSLLAQPVQFTVLGSGAVVIGQTGSGVVTVASSRITVRDHAAFQLPATGGTGVAPYVLSGLVLLAAAGMAVVRRRPDDGIASGR